jgi:DNA-binding MarR family transcriptional regulator
VKQLHKRPSPVPGEATQALERLFEMAVRLTGGMDQGLARQGLSRARAELIWNLRRAGPTTQRRLSNRLRCSPRNVTGLVDGLEAAGLVSRAPHPTDRRATLVALTEEGTALVAAWEAGQQQMASSLFSDLSEEEIRTFLGTLERILGALRRNSSG